jgi:3-oxoacyl-[acyl-carrier-protein] synthase-3
MAFIHLPNVSVKGIAVCVPKAIKVNKTLTIFGLGEADKFINTTGVESSRIANDEICTSDLCYHAAEKLITDLAWNKSEIDCLIFVSQTPDFRLPATSCILQERLNLNQEIVVFDISLGCTGWLYGLNLISSLLSSGALKKGLLLVGDTILKSCSTTDKTTFPLFGDAGTATALEFENGTEGLRFHLACDGSGYKTIIIPDGGYRNVISESSFEIADFEPGVKRNKQQLVMDGMNVFSFGITKAPESIRMLTDHFKISHAEVDYFVFHQANMFMNEKIRKKLNLPIEKVPYSLKEYGNTSCATIPLTICLKIGDDLLNNPKTIIACAFGVGLSWGSVFFNTNNFICSELIEI